MRSGILRSLFGRGAGASPGHDAGDGRRVHQEPDAATVIRLPPAAVPPGFDHTLAAAVMVGDEVACIREWVAFHLTVGCEVIHIYTNWLDRAAATRREVDDFVAAGLVTITPWPDIFSSGQSGQFSAFQNYCYAHAIMANRGRTRWLALIDADEFLYSPVEDDLKAVLRPLEERPAVAVNWVNFGSGGHAVRPDGLVIDAYTEAATGDCILNRQYKSVVQPHRITGVFNAHRFLTDEPGVCAYSEAGEPLGNWPYEFNRPTGRLLRLNHYSVKSAAEFNDRLSTGWATLAPHVRERRLRNRQWIEASTTADHGIRRFADRTRALMAAGPR